MPTEIKMVDTVSTVIKTGQTENIQIIGQYLQFANRVTQSIMGNTNHHLFHMARACEGCV